MNIKYMLISMEYEHVHDALMKLYPEESPKVVEGIYRSLFSELRKVNEIENENNMTIHVQYVKEHERAERFMWDVTYSLDRRYHHQYGLQFATTEQIVSSLVPEEDLISQSAEEYLAHILFEVAREGQMDEQEDDIHSVEPKNHLPHFTGSVEICSKDDVMKDSE